MLSPSLRPGLQADKKELRRLEIPIKASKPKKPAPTGWAPVLKKAAPVIKAIAKAEKDWERKQKPKVTVVVKPPKSHRDDRGFKSKH